MIKTHCDFCKEEIKTPLQFYLNVYSCETGTSHNSDGADKEVWHYSFDFCQKCNNKLKKKSLKNDKKGGK